MTPRAVAYNNGTTSLTIVVHLRRASKYYGFLAQLVALMDPLKLAAPNSFRLIAQFVALTDPPKLTCS